MNYEDHRRNYVLGGLRSTMLTDTPFELFEQWQQQAIDAGRLDAGKPVDTAALLAAGVIRRPRDGVRLLAEGELKASLTIEVAGASAAAVAAVEKAGGKVTQTVVRDEAAIAAKADKRRARGKGKSAAADA